MLDETRYNIKKSIDESRNQIPRINIIVNGYQAFNGLVTNFCTPDAAIKAYTRFVSNVADITVSAIRLSNDVIFSTLDAWKPALQQSKDISRHISNTWVNAARVFEQNYRQIAVGINDAANSSVNTSTTSTTTNSTSY